MLVPNISLQQQEGCCCHSNCFQTWQLFLPSPTNPSPLPQLILCFDVYFFFSFFFPFFFISVAHKGMETAHIHQQRACGQRGDASCTGTEHP